MNKKLKKILFGCSKVINHLPFNNLFRGKNKITLNKSIVIKSSFISKGKNNTITINCGSYFKRCSFFIAGSNNKVVIGKNVTAINVSIHIEDDNNTIMIGDNSFFAGQAHFACIESTNITIGDNCMFSSEVTIRTGDSHSVLDLDMHRINRSKNVSIGNHVWICNDVKINKGVIVSDNSIVGTGSIVTKEFRETNVVIAGIPAKIVKKGVNWDGAR